MLCPYRTMGYGDLAVEINRSFKPLCSWSETLFRRSDVSRESKMRAFATYVAPTPAEAASA